MNVDLIDSFAVPALILLFGWLFNGKMKNICKTVNKVDKRTEAYEKMKAGVETHCIIYKHHVKNEP